MFKRRKMGTAGGRAAGGQVGSSFKVVGANEKARESNGSVDSIGPAKEVSKEPESQNTDISGHSINEKRRMSDSNHEGSVSNSGGSAPSSVPGSKSDSKSVPSNTNSQTQRTQRTPTIFHDLQPNICKDYHKTGYCSYGDTCKFAHIRDLHPAKVPATKPLEEVVNTCPICNKNPTKAGKLKCGHSCCLECFLKVKPKKCPRCDAATNESISMG